MKAVKVSVDSLHSEVGYLRAEMKGSIDALRIEMKLRDEIHTLALRNLSEKLEFTIELRERLASIEARLPRQ